MAGALRSETCSPRSCPVPGGESAQSTSEGPGSMDSIGLVRVIFDQGVRGDAPCITHGSIGQRSCGRPQVDFKPTFFLIPIKSRHAHSPGVVQVRLRCLENGLIPQDQVSALGGASSCRSDRDAPLWGNDSPIARAKPAYSLGHPPHLGQVRISQPPMLLHSNLAPPAGASHEAHNVHWSRLFRGPRQDRER